MASHWASRSAVAGIGSAMMELMNPGPQRYERIDLHTHSTWSDGALSPAELVALAATRQVQLLALTDHDTVAGCPEAAAACAAHQIDFVPGCELTALWRDREIHIVGLGLDTTSAALEAHLGGVQAQRRERIAAIEVSLAGMGRGDASQAASLARRNSLAGSSGSDFHLPGLPWRPLGRLAKLPEGVVSVTEQLGQGPRSQAPPAWPAPQAS